MPPKIAHQLAEKSDSTDVLYSPIIERIHTSTSGEPRDVHHALPSPNTPESHWIRWCFAHTASALWRTEALRQIGGWDVNQTCCQDNELCYRALRGNLQATATPTPEAIYRVWSSATVSRKDPGRILKERTRLTEMYIEHLAENEAFNPQLRTAAAQSFFEMARSIYGIDKKWACRYAKERIARNLFTPTGPAASSLYKLAYRAGGFAFAERVAQVKRMVRIQGNRQTS